MAPTRRPEITSSLPKDVSGKVPSWLRRALNSKTPTTKDNETMRTASVGVEDGKEILFPTIRMIGGKLAKFSVEAAKDYALEKRDYIVRDSAAQATSLSKSLSRAVARSRANRSRKEGL